MARRWKMLLALGVSLIVLGLIGNWPPQTDPSVPETRSFLLVIGGFVIVAGIAIGRRQDH